jgi:anthranilate phosphoribosyltransferase
MVEGVKQAREAVASGRALSKLSQFVAVTQKLKG